MMRLKNVCVLAESLLLPCLGYAQAEKAAAG